MQHTYLCLLSVPLTKMNVLAGQRSFCFKLMYPKLELYLALQRNPVRVGFFSAGVSGSKLLLCGSLEAAETGDFVITGLQHALCSVTQQLYSQTPHPPDYSGG